MDPVEARISRTIVNQAPAATQAPIPVALVGLGAIGREVAVAARRRQGLSVWAAVDVDPEKVSRDLGSVLNQEAWGVTIASSLPARPGSATANGRAPAAGRAGAQAPVALHTTGSFLEDVAPQILALVEQGLHVVSSAEELAYPALEHPAIAAEIDAAARRHGVAVVGLGVNPGFAMDALPAVISSAAQDVRLARVVRVVDTSRRRLNLQRKSGAGMTPEAFHEALARGKMGHIGLAESCALLALALGWRVDRVVTEIAPVIADRLLKSEYLEVAAGRVAGLHQVASGMVGDRMVVELDLTMALGGVEDRDEVHLVGDPCLELVVPGGLPGDVATAATLLNAVPAIVRAEPGLRTILDLPLPHFGR